MALVIEAPEVVQTIDYPLCDEASTISPVVALPQRRQTAFLSRLGARVAAVIHRCEARQTDRQRVDAYRFHMESPVDKLAREHPYLYIKSLSG